MKKCWIIWWNWNKNEKLLCFIWKKVIKLGINYYIYIENYKDLFKAFFNEE